MVLHFSDLYNKYKSKQSTQQTYGQSDTFPTAAAAAAAAAAVNVVNSSSNSYYVEPQVAIKQHSFLVFMMTSFAVVDIIVAILILANADMADCPRDVVYSCLFVSIATFVVVIVTFWFMDIWYYRVTGHNLASEPVAV